MIMTLLEKKYSDFLLPVIFFRVLIPPRFGSLRKEHPAAQTRRQRTMCAYFAACRLPAPVVTNPFNFRDIVVAFIQK